MKTECEYKQEQNDTSSPENRRDKQDTTRTHHTSAQPGGEGEPSLQQLLQICLETGESARWTEFVRRSQPLIARVVTKTIRSRTRPNPDLIDDLVQESYVKLCFNNFTILRRFVPRHDHALAGFLKVVASNTVRDHFRSASNRKRGGGMAEVPMDCIPERPVSRRPFEAFERQILLREIKRNLLEAYSDSPSAVRDCEIFALYYRHGWTAEAISRLPSIRLSCKGVESTILRIVRLIKLMMGKRHTH